MARCNVLHAVLAVVLSLLVLLPGAPARAQTAQGATMTVLRGQVAVVRENGSAVQPAPSGTTVVPGDEIRTLAPGSALVTFFSGIELELGQDTIVLIGEMSQQGDRVNVSISQVFGTTVSRIASLTDSSSSYRIENGGAVALVRGSTVAMRGPDVTPNGTFAAAVCIACGRGDYLEALDERKNDVVDAPVSSAGKTPGMYATVLPTLDADPGNLLDETFWKSIGYPGSDPGDGTVQAAAATQRVPIGDARGTSYGYGWEVSKCRSPGRRTVAHRGPRGEMLGTIITQCVWTMIGQFEPFRTRPREDPVGQAADAITNMSQLAEGGQSPGGSNPGTRQTNSSKPADDDDDGPTNSDSHGDSHGFSARVTRTSIGCEATPSDPQYNCGVNVEALDLTGPPPSGNVQFVVTSGAGTFTPVSGICTLAPFGPPWRSRCSINFTRITSNVGIQANYLPDDVQFSPSSDETEIGL